MRAFLLTLFLTMLLGVALRFDLLTGVLASVGLAFADVRHAHSHIGFYGTLTLAWWLLFRRRDLHLLGAPTTQIYVVLVLVTSLLFGVMGYALPTIILSTVVAGFWLVTAWRTARDPRLHADMVRLAPWGVVLGMLLIPAIALTARRDFALSRDLAHVFIGVMLLLTFVPIALSSLGVRSFRVFAFGFFAALGSAHVVFADRSPWPLGLTSVLAGLLLAPALRGLAAPPWLRLTWWALPPGMALMGIAAPLQQEGVRVAALHYLVLGPLLLTALQVLVPHKLAAHRVVFAVALGALALKLTAMLMGPLFEWPPALHVAAWAALVLVLAMAFTLLIPAARRPSGGAQ